jgi:hypothetical protein
MPGIGDGSFLPLEGLGGNKFYAKSGVVNILQPLDGDGQAYYHSDGAGTFPALEGSASFQMGGTFDGRGRLPSMTGAGQGGHTGKGILPALTMTFTATITRLLRGQVTLPALTGEASGIGGVSWRVEASLPRLGVVGAFGWRSSALLPAMQAAATMSWTIRGSSTASLPALQGSSVFTVFSLPAHGAGVLPALQSVYMLGRAELPSLQATATFAATDLGYEAWVLNTRNNAVTHWTGLEVTQFARYGNRTLMVGGGNLYLVGGDLDDTAPIPWSFETGLDDLGSPGLKHIPYLYIDGIIDGEIQITLLDDRGREFAYEYDTKQRGAVHQPHKRKLGNGIRTRNVGFRISSTTGAYIELDALEPEATITQRSL